MTGRMLYDKLWDDHIVHAEDDGTTILYIDLHLLNEVTSPQAFKGLDLAGRKVWRLSSNLAVRSQSAGADPAVLSFRRGPRPARL